MNIDLSKCAIGTKVALRNGKVGTLTTVSNRANDSHKYTIHFKTSSGQAATTTTAGGYVYHASNPAEYDVVGVYIGIAKPKVDPLIFGASLPEFLPVPESSYVPLTSAEAGAILQHVPVTMNAMEVIQYVHRMGHEGRRKVI